MKQKDVVEKEIRQELNWREKIIAYIFKKTCIKIYKEGVRKGFNWGA